MSQSAVEGEVCTLLCGRRRGIRRFLLRNQYSNVAIEINELGVSE